LSKKQPTGEKTWWISTGHITEADGVLVGKPATPGHVATHDGGFGDLLCLDYENDAHFAKCISEYTSLGFSAAFIRIIKKAAKNKICWVWFDADGEEIKGWATFNW